MSDIFRDYSFGGQLREIRIEREETMRAFANRIGFDVGNYSKLESGRLSPPKTRKKCEDLLIRLEVPKDRWPWLLSKAFDHHLGKLHGEWGCE